MIEDTPTQETQTKEFDPSEGNPFISTAADISRRLASDSTPNQTTNQNLVSTPTPSETSKGLSRGQKAGVAIALTGAIGLGVGGLISLEGGSSSGAERGTVDNTIESITLTPDAHLRLDPYVGDPKDNMANDVLDLGVKVTIDASHDIRVLNDTSEGTWYGIPMNEIAAVAPNAASVNDKDHMLWVNEQGVEELTKAQLPTE